MSKKYNFNNNQEEIDEPSIVRINKNLISITHASGTDITEIPDDEELLILVGNIESYNPSTLSPEPAPEIIPNTSNDGNSEESDGNSGSQEGGNEQESGNEGENTNPTPPSGFQNAKSGTINLTIQNNTGSTMNVENQAFIYVLYRDGTPHLGVYINLPSTSLASTSLASGKNNLGTVTFLGNSDEYIVGNTLEYASSYKNFNGNWSVKMYPADRHTALNDLGHTLSISGTTLQNGGSYTITIN